MRLNWIIAVIILNLPSVYLLQGQNFQAFLDNLRAIPVEERQDAVDQYLQAKGDSFPILEKNKAIFIYNAIANSAAIAGDFNNWSPGNDEMTMEEGTHLFHLTKSFPSTARLDYKIVVNNNQWILDPLNPNVIAGGFGYNSELAMEEYIHPWEVEEYLNTKKGTLESHQVESNFTGRTYDIKVYLPNSYNPANSYPSAYFHDGQDYLALGAGKEILDNLIDSGLIKPIVAIFVKPTDRGLEYAGNLRGPYRLFFANELVPYLESRYSLLETADQRATIGTSLGGNISALISFLSPEVFGLSGWHSPAFQVNDREALDIIEGSTNKDVKVAAVWGDFEQVIVNVATPARDHLLSIGTDLYWDQLPEGHSWGLWRATLDDLLIHLFKSEPTSTFETTKPDFLFNLNLYPNPSSKFLTLSWNSSQPVNQVELEVRDSLGRLIVFEKSVPHQIRFNVENWDDGWYLITVRAGKYVLQKRFVKQG